MAAARAAHPGGALASVALSDDPAATTGVVLAVPALGEELQRTVFVDPYSGEVRGAPTTWFGSTPLTTWDRSGGCTRRSPRADPHAPRDRWAHGASFTKYPMWHFAYANNERVVMHYETDGWGPDNIDRVFAHETGHVFGCPDEYAASNCTRGGAHGRFGDPNANCENCAPGGGIDCIMKANDWAMCRWTYRHLGWMSPLRTADGGGLSFVSSPADRLGVFAVDTDRMIRTAFWQPDMPGWFRGWVDVLGGRPLPAPR